MNFSTSNFLKLEGLMEDLNIELIKTEHIASAITAIGGSSDMLPYIISIASMRTRLQDTYNIISEIYATTEKDNL
jgi:hypothetical protein